MCIPNPQPFGHSDDNEEHVEGKENLSARTISEQLWLDWHPKNGKSVTVGDANQEETTGQVCQQKLFFSFSCFALIVAKENEQCIFTPKQGSLTPAASPMNFTNIISPTR